MVETFTAAQPNQPSNRYIAQHAVYVNSKGQKCEANDKDVQRVLVAKGDSIDAEVAKAAGVDVSSSAQPGSQEAEALKKRVEELEKENAQLKQQQQGYQEVPSPEASRHGRGR